MDKNLCSCLKVTKIMTFNLRTEIPQRKVLLAPNVKFDYGHYDNAASGTHLDVAVVKPLVDL